MVKLDAPKKVTLPNDINFYAKYKRVRINSLPNNMRTGRRYRRRIKNNNQRPRLKNALKMVLTSQNVCRPVRPEEILRK